MIELDGLARVLPDVASDYKVLGFDSFTLEGLSVQPRLDYYTDFQEGVSIDEALSAIAGWPLDEGLWVEAVLIKG